MLSDEVFQVVMGDQITEVRHIFIGLPQGSFLAPVLVNIYTANLPEPTSNKFANADEMIVESRRTTNSSTD